MDLPCQTEHPLYWCRGSKRRVEAHEHILHGRVLIQLAELYTCIILLPDDNFLRVTWGKSWSSSHRESIVVSAFWGHGRFRCARTCCWRALISRLYKQSLTSILYIRVTNSKRGRNKMQFEPRIAHSRDYGHSYRIFVVVQLKMIPKPFS